MREAASENRYTLVMLQYIGLSLLLKSLEYCMQFSIMRGARVNIAIDINPLQKSKT
jgi:hypothetical protein